MKESDGIYNLARIISKLKMYEHSLLYHAVFSWRKGRKCSAMRKLRSVILCFLFVYFLFCEYYYTGFISRYQLHAKKGLFLSEQDYAFSLICTV